VTLSPQLTSSTHTNPPPPDSPPWEQRELWSGFDGWLSPNVGYGVGQQAFGGAFDVVRSPAEHR